MSTLTGIVVSRLSSPTEHLEATAVCTMALEALMVLCNPEVGLSPTAPPDVAAREETPPVTQSAAVATFLLLHLPSIGANAVIGHRILRLLAASPHGRTALRKAALQVFQLHEGRPPPPPSDVIDPVQLAAAAQALANRYWTVAEQLNAYEAGEGLKAAFSDVVTMAQEICTSLEGDRVGEVPPAPARFVAALQASLAAAADTGAALEESRWEGVEAGEARVRAAVHDPVTRMFWKNVKARVSRMDQFQTARPYSFGFPHV
jgi:hypothetical protein